MHTDIPLNKLKIMNELDCNKYNMKIFESIGSTNDYLISTNEDVNLCLAEHQTVGRGRHNKEWHSPLRKNIYLSFKKIMHINPRLISSLSIIISLSILKTIKQFIGGNGICIKWPNDIVSIDGKKIAGILVETKSNDLSSLRVIIGVGINVNMDMNQDFMSKWCSMKQLTNIHYDRNNIISKTIYNIEEYINKYLKMGLVYFINEWNLVDFLYNKTIVINNNISGIANGIDNNGHILLRKNGITTSYHSSNVSIGR